MRTCLPLWAALAAFSSTSILLAQPATQPADSRLERLEQRLNEMERQLQADLKARDAEIARLRSQVKDDSASKNADQDAIDQTTQDLMKDIESRSAATQTLRIPASFNPDFAVVGDFVGSLSTNKANPARNRFDIREVELDLRAAVDPRADGVVVLPFSRDVSDPVFFDRATANGAVDSSFDIEEAYIFLHDFGVPNLTAKLGRFHLRFGRWNLLHKHDWMTTDNNFMSQSFLGAESLNDSGLSLSYVIPPKLIGNQYVEVIAEIISGEGAAGNPVLNNDALVHSPALNLHALWNHDIADNWNLEVGGSWLNAKHNNDDHQHVNLFGVDTTLIHTDHTGKFNNQVFQFEGIYGAVDSARHDLQHSLGAFFIAQQQLNRDIYGGLRLDWTQNALDQHKEVWGVSPYVSWYWSEFLRFRVEYQHKQGDTPHEDTLYFQCTFIFGAHPPHPYWALH